MNTVDPIRDARRISAIKNILKAENPRDYALFTLGINTALRVGDLLHLRVSDVFNFQGQGEVRKTLRIRERKTGREAIVRLNKPAQEALKVYLDTVPGLSYDSYLFPGKSGDRPLHRNTVYHKVNKWCQMVGLTEGRYGCHTLRKTWGYQARVQKGVPLELIQAKLGHRSPATTRRYIGITQEEIGAVEERVEL